MTLAAAFGLAVPWSVGATLLLAFGPWPRRRFEWASLVGRGLLLGFFLATLLLRMQDLLMGRFHAASAVAFMILLGAVAAWAAYRREEGRDAPAPPVEGDALVGYGRWTWWLILALVLLRLAPIVGEILLRPVYPWDAWGTWAVMAKLWTIEGRMIPFAPPREWLQGATAGVHALDAWHYPGTLPLFQVWMGVVGGGWSDMLVNLPWAAALTALGLACYGEARSVGAGPMPSMIFAYVLLSLPLLNAHAALAGYADLWLTYALGLAAMSLVRWGMGHGRTHLCLAFLWLLIAAMLKVEGIVWVFTFLPAMAALYWRGRTLLIATIVAVGLSLLWYGVGGFSFETARWGAFTLTPERIALPYLGAFEVGYRGVWSPAAKNLFVFANWHLFWYLLVPILLWGGWASRSDRIARALTALVCAGLAMLFVLFFFTGASEWVVKHTSVNRVVMHFVVPTAFLGLWLVVKAIRASSGQNAPG